MDILDDMGVSKLSAKVFFKSELLFNMWPFKMLSIIMFSVGIRVRRGPDIIRGETC